MAKRHADALAIQQGAANPAASADAINDACQEVREEGGVVTEDAAVCLMAQQLAFICGVGEIEGSFAIYNHCILPSCAIWRYGLEHPDRSPMSGDLGLGGNCARAMEFCLGGLIVLDLLLWLMSLGPVRFAFSKTIQEHKCLTGVR